MRRKYAKESEKKMCKNETKKRKRRMRVSRKKNPDKTNERTDNKPCTIEKRRTGKTMTGRRGARGPSGGPNAGPEPVNTPPPPWLPARARHGAVAAREGPVDTSRNGCLNEGIVSQCTG